MERQVARLVRSGNDLDHSQSRCFGRVEGEVEGSREVRRLPSGRAVLYIILAKKYKRRKTKQGKEKLNYLCILANVNKNGESPTHVCPRSRERAKFARESLAPGGLDSAKVTPLSLAPALPFPGGAIPPMWRSGRSSMVTQEATEGWPMSNRLLLLATFGNSAGEIPPYILLW